MPERREFEIRREVGLPAARSQAWQAISTRAGLSGWFMPMDVAPGADGVGPDSPVRVWDPPARLALHSPPEPDGTVHAFDYTLTETGSDACRLGFAHSGVLAGTDTAVEVSALESGWAMYLHTLGEYLRHFAGARATYVSAQGPRGSAAADAWPQLLAALDLPGPPTVGQPVWCSPAELPAIAGVVDYVAPGFLGIRAPAALHRFHDRSALGLTAAVAHHHYAQPGLGAVDSAELTRRWTAWLAGVWS